ncbi:RNA-binding protein 4B-like [Branchiostoma floridae]|uniref:RNA-binding protein 4B-like n=1 Tax=Branchiostoma floridae TaxID=7739 RepID=A0A9J7LY60_BRAFL|nr:RNA-binding protein 4B-like [Branchiostoma floridae]
MSFNRGRPFPGRNSSKGEMTTKLYVGNVPQPARKKDLQDLFEKFGKVNECDIIKNYGFVHMDNEQDANDAIKALTNTEWMGTRITVEMSKSKVRTQPGQGSRGECYRCGKMGHWSRDCPTDGGKRGRGGGGVGGGRGPPPPAYDDGYDRDRGDRYGDYMQRRLPPPPPDYYYRMRYMDPVYDRYRDRYYERLSESKHRLGPSTIGTPSSVPIPNLKKDTPMVSAQLYCEAEMGNWTQISTQLSQQDHENQLCAMLPAFHKL